jgi:hypothetical protein
MEDGTMTSKPLFALALVILTGSGCETAPGSTGPSRSVHGEWPVNYLKLQPAQITVRSGTTFDCYDVKCRLLGLKDSDDPVKREKATEFTRRWFQELHNWIHFMNDQGPLVEDGDCLVWIQGSARWLLYLNADLVSAGLVDIDLTSHENYSFLVTMKRGPDEPFAWQDHLRRAKKEFDGGKKSPAREWFEELSLKPDGKN